MPANSEYQRHRLKCSCCGETTCAELPEGVPKGQSGPRLMAFVALLMAYYLHSNRRTAEFLGAILGQPRCPALTVKIQIQVAASLMTSTPDYESRSLTLGTTTAEGRHATRHSWRWREVLASKVVLAFIVGVYVSFRD